MEIVSTPNAPTPAGHYSQGTVHNGVLYIAGQVPLDPATGTLKTESFEAQARQVFANLSAIADAAGTTLQNTLKVTIYVSDMKHWKVCNEVFAEAFGECKPARAIVPVCPFKGFDLEAEAVVAVD
jgi:2-iminobutanoate/2-iminopropanoate deaminase